MLLLIPLEERSHLYSSGLRWSQWIKEEEKGVPSIEAMWTESCRLKKKQMQEAWLSEGGHVWCVGGKAAEAEETGRGALECYARRSF